jgi:hypothetical protein
MQADYLCTDEVSQNKIKIGVKNMILIEISHTCICGKKSKHEYFVQEEEDIQSITWTVNCPCGEEKKYKVTDPRVAMFEDYAPIRVETYKISTELKHKLKERKMTIKKFCELSGLSYGNIRKEISCLRNFNPEEKETIKLFLES